MPIGGSGITISLKGRVFPLTVDADIMRVLGGVEDDILMNGDGSARFIKKRIPWKLGATTVSMDDTRMDQEYLKDLQKSNEPYPIIITYPTDITYMATGKIIGEIAYGNQTTSATFVLSGGGDMAQQA